MIKFSYKNTEGLFTRDVYPKTGILDRVKRFNLTSLTEDLPFVKKHLFLSQSTGKGRGGIMSPSGPPGHFDLTKLAHCTSTSCFLQNKPTIRPLRHILRKFTFFDKVPLWGPRGSGLDQNCTCTTRPWGQQNVTMNRYLLYLVTEEIEEQDIVYRQIDRQTVRQTDRRTAGRRTKEYRISSTGRRAVELKHCAMCENLNLICGTLK